MTSLRAAGALVSLLLLAGCGSSGAVDAGNTEPVDLEQFTQASDRFAVLSTLGQPNGSVTHELHRCDIYKLYTTGLGAGGKAVMKGAEVLTSIATLGLAQIIWAPVRAGTRPNEHTVLFCYAQGDQLVEILDKNPMTDAPPRIRIVNAKLYSQPVIVTAAAPASDAAPAPITVQRATPVLSAPAGQISLANVSREAIDGPHRVKIGQVIIPGDASTDDLNSLSSQKSAEANAPALAAQKSVAPAAPGSITPPG